MSREKFLNTLLAVLVIVPATYLLVSNSLVDSRRPNSADIEIPDEIEQGNNSGWRLSIGESLYAATVLVISFALLRVTGAVDRRRKWIWAIFLVLLLPIAALSLVLRVHRGKPFVIPRTIEDQRQIIRAKADEIRNQRN